MVFDIEPEGFHRNPTVVVGCYFLFENEILLLHRHPDKPQGGTWCLPGGKLVGAEDSFKAICREAGEETGEELEKARLKYLRTFYVRYPDQDFIYILFSYKFNSRPTIVLAHAEHVAFRWVTMSEALQMNLILGEAECMRRAFGLT